MKLFFITFLAFFSALGLVRISKNSQKINNNAAGISIKPIFKCSPDWSLLNKYMEGTDIPPMPGAGKYKWDIHTRSDSAQFYFNQGINMYYGFHIIESMASFIKAAKFDAPNPMLWWARALAYGPNINDAGYTASPLAFEAANKAQMLSATASPFEKALIDAMVTRYSNDPTESRAALNSRYTSAMEKVYLGFRGNADAAALYADAMMLEHPWEFWKAGGLPYPWTPRIRKVLESGLMKAPEHPGINHYYIHVMEPSPYPQKAMASANRLGKLNPGLSHLVHMPSHIYLRTGFYTKGYSVNEEAVKQYKSYVHLFPAAIGNEALYKLHNEHMLVNCAMHAGRKKYAIDAALSLQHNIDTAFIAFPGGTGNFMQYTYMAPALIMVRFEDWEGLLNATSVEDKYVYASLLAHFGKGMAYCARNKIAAARGELSILETLLNDSSLYAPFAPFSPAIDGATIATNLLKGSIALKENSFSESIHFFKEAAEREKKMVYNEPRDWLLNPKNYLGTAYMATGDYKSAEAAFKQDLDDNNENVWSLSGLYKALLRQNKKAGAAQVLIRLKKASTNSDVSLVN
ncbi:MAG: tetratricopeptide repeat protein [Bacteroidetes bacterium]|nr:tetratricopeptide repeat protein [Bacteroidota bacterium]MBS1973993.1 tetratricopeptide repeat protein [Bacteroidota bacterium]